MGGQPPCLESSGAPICKQERIQVMPALSPELPGGAKEMRWGHFLVTWHLFGHHSLYRLLQEEKQLWAGK